MRETTSSRGRRGRPGSEEAHRDLLRSIVEVARAIFHARAASIFLLDEEADELVFEAIAGEGSDSLVGTRFPLEYRDRGLGARDAPAAPPRRRDPGSPLCPGCAEATGYLPRG